MDIKDIITVGISLVALLISGINFLREKKKSKNVLLRLSVLVDAIKHDFYSIRFQHGMIYFVPDMKNEEYEKPFEVKLKSLESNISKFYDLLLLNQQIADEDVRTISKSLLNIEFNLFELATFTVENAEDMDVTKSFTNPIIKEIEIIESLITQYDN